MKTRIFYDFEATSVARTADMVSVGLIAVDKNNSIIKTFYAEFTDFNIDKCDKWVKKNIIDKLKGCKSEPLDINADNINICGDTDFISKQLTQWLSQFKSVEFWADYDTIDKPMLVDLISDWNVNELGFKTGLPNHLPNIKYFDFYDIHTLFKAAKLDPDMDRTEYSDVNINNLPEAFNYEQHHPLYDCYISFQCYIKLMRQINSSLIFTN